MYGLSFPKGAEIKRGKFPSSPGILKSLNFSGRDFRHKESDGNVAHIIKFTILRRVFTYEIKINYRKYCVLSLRPMHPVLLRPSLKVKLFMN